MQLRAVALEEVFEGDISFIRLLVRESGIDLDERDAEVSLFWLILGVSGSELLNPNLLFCSAMNGQSLLI